MPFATLDDAAAPALADPALLEPASAIAKPPIANTIAATPAAMNVASFFLLRILWSRVMVVVPCLAGLYVLSVCDPALSAPWQESKSPFVNFQEVGKDRSISQVLARRRAVPIARLIEYSRRMPP